MSIPNDAYCAWSLLVPPVADRLTFDEATKRLALIMAATISGKWLGPAGGSQHVTGFLASMGGVAGGRIAHSARNLTPGVKRMLQDSWLYQHKTDEYVDREIVKFIWSTFRDKTRFAKRVYNEDISADPRGWKVHEFTEYVHMYMSSREAPVPRPAEILVRIDRRDPSHVVVTLTPPDRSGVKMYRLSAEKLHNLYGIRFAIADIATKANLTHIIDVNGNSVPLDRVNLPLQKTDLFIRGDFESRWSGLEIASEDDKPVAVPDRLDATRPKVTRWL